MSGRQIQKRTGVPLLDPSNQPRGGSGPARHTASSHQNPTIGSSWGRDSAPQSNNKANSPDPIAQLAQHLKPLDDHAAKDFVYNKLLESYYEGRFQEAIPVIFLATIRHCVTVTLNASLLNRILDPKRLECVITFGSYLEENISCCGSPIMAEAMKHSILFKSLRAYDHAVAEVLGVMLSALLSGWKKTGMLEKDLYSNHLWQQPINGKMYIKRMEGGESRTQEITPLQYALEASCLPFTAGKLLEWGATLKEEEEVIGSTIQQRPNLERCIFVPANEQWAKLKIDSDDYQTFLDSCWYADSQRRGNQQDALDHWVNLMKTIAKEAIDSQRLWVKFSSGRDMKLSSMRLAAVLDFMRDRKNTRWHTRYAEVECQLERIREMEKEEMMGAVNPRHRQEQEMEGKKRETRNKDEKKSADKNNLLRQNRGQRRN